MAFIGQNGAIERLCDIRLIDRGACTSPIARPSSAVNHSPNVNNGAVIEADLPQGDCSYVRGETSRRVWPVTAMTRYMGGWMGEGNPQGRCGGYRYI